MCFKNIHSCDFWHKITYVDVYVFDKLRCDIGAVVPLGCIRHVCIAVPLPAGTVGIGGCWGGVLHPCGRYNTNRLTCNNNAIMLMEKLSKNVYNVTKTAENIFFPV